MDSLWSVEGTQGPSPGPPKRWTCNLNLRTGRTSAPSGGRRLLGPPGVEAPVGLLFAERSFVEPKFEQEVEGAADDRPLLDVEMLHDLSAVEIGPDGGEFFL